MTTILKEFIGFSSSKILLLKDHDEIFVRKIGEIDRNLERLIILNEHGVSVPKILKAQPDYYDMEYVPNLDIRNFLIRNQSFSLSKFIVEVIRTLSKNAIQKDYTEIFEKKLSKIDFTGLPFISDQLLEKLPKILPCSLYHGDFTLDNILYDVKRQQFVLIDPITTEYDSYVFDLAKLRQDLTCKWFIRNSDVYFDLKLKIISDELETFEHFNNDYILILMLLRILPYAKSNQDKKFLLMEIKKLWK